MPTLNPHTTDAETAALDARLSVIEARFDGPSAYIADVVEDNATIESISVPTAAWAASVTSAVNGLRTCAIDHGLMESP